MSFYFTIVDDTDDAFYYNIKPVYDYLYEKNILITKTVWVYPPRDKHSYGDSLQTNDYLQYIKVLIERGYEIGLHGVGSGDYKREEILLGIEEFKNKLGFYPKVHVNHSYNKDSIYGGSKRFNFPFNKIVEKLYPQYAGVLNGDNDSSEFFWGDKHKDIIAFSRNHEFDCINTRKRDKYMPYRDPKRIKYANYWYSATFAPNPIVFHKILSEKNINKLDKECGICILYTHLGYFYRNSILDLGFKKSIDYLSSKSKGIFIPLTKILLKIAEDRKDNNLCEYPSISYLSKAYMEVMHLMTRIKYRYFIKIDDYAFKSLNNKMFIEK